MPDRALCRFVDENRRPAFALYREGQIAPLSSLTDDAPRGGDLFRRGPNWIMSLPEPTEADWRSAPATLLPPVAAPQKVICIGLNYRDHAIETGAEIPSQPVVFSKFNTALVGHGGDIVLPEIAERVDYEAELVVVIGKTARQVDPSEALGHVYGYTCGHDVSARDWQKGRPGGQWLLGKSFDTFGPLGPAIVPAANFDPGGARVRMHLNGETVQDSSTRQLIFDVPTLVAHLSKFMTLRAGDLIYTGTPPGVGAARTPPVFLKPGDVCEVEIDGIGRLSNPVVGGAG